MIAHGEIRSVGREAQPLAIVDGFAGDPEALRDAAAAAAFEPARHHYPGIRAPIPDDYLEARWPTIVEAVAAAFGHRGAIETLDASFSIVTTPAERLEVRQRLPHCDAFDPARIAMVHYLSFDEAGGTAFFRHRSTGFETIDARRAPIFFDQLDAELRHGGLPSGYIAGDTPLFERLALVDARCDRAVFYRSCLLHSGAIEPGATLLADPRRGRLTVTAFFALA